jgi:hypothetical protein
VAASSLAVPVGLLLSNETAARAQQEPQDPEPIRLEYRAEEGCPNLDGFVARVRARTRLVRPAWPGEEARSFRVALEAGPPARGLLTITGDERPPGSRSVHAGTCAEAADALSMVFALAVDARLAAQAPALPAISPVESSLPAAAASSSPPRVDAMGDLREAPSATQSPTTTAGASAAPAPPTVDKPPVDKPPADKPQPAAVLGRRAEDLSTDHAFFAGDDFVVATGVTSTAVLSVSPYIGWRAPGATWWAPSLRLSFIRDQRGPFDQAGGGSATFTWTVGRVDACARLGQGLVVDLSACARVEAGTLEGAGSDIVAAQSRLRLWLAAGPLVRVAWPFARAFFVDADLGIQFRVTHDQFVFQPASTVYQVPPVGLATGAGLGVRFL